MVRSLYRKMRTPFTRSHTVDENLMRYYSPETSEYTVSEGYMLKPEVLSGTTKNRIPEIYVEDCLQVDFNDRLVEKFRNGRTGGSATSSSYATPYSLSRKKPTTASLSSRLRAGWKEPLENSIVSRSRLLGRVGLGSTDYELRNLESRPHPRRSLLFAKARSFDYNVVNDQRSGAVFATGRARDTGFLSRRAKSFEYETVSSNIFSDDSLRTARRKLKRNMSISDSKYGDKIPALRDRSKSYYDNGDKGLRTKLADESPIDYQDFGELDDRAKHFYGYDSEVSTGETEIYCANFDKQSVESVIEAKNFRGPVGLDFGKRKYMETGYRSPEKRTKSLEHEYGPLDGNDHIYCSIDEIILPEDPCECRILESAGRGRSKYDNSLLHRNTIDALEGIDDYVTRRHVKPRRRTKSTDSYLEDEYERYENWEAEYGVDYPEPEALSDSRIPSLECDDYYDQRDQASPKKQRSSRFVDDYDAYRETGSYVDESLSYRDDVEDRRNSYEDASSPRRRRTRRDNEEPIVNEYENLCAHDVDYTPVRKVSLTVPSFSESKRMMIGRAESTPILVHDDEYGVSEERTARRMSRRRRNSSCPETRETIAAENGTTRRAEEAPCGYFVDSEEEFGSMETVIGPNYGDRKIVNDQREFVDSRSRIVTSPEFDYRRPGRAEKSGSFSGTTRYRSEEDPSSGYDYRRPKSSCPECRELSISSEGKRISTTGRDEEDDAEARYRYRRRRNSSCPEARDIELFDEESRRRSLAGREERLENSRQQQQGSKRNVAISDTLEYYEYSMESESQCSENCGFGPYDPLRPRNRAAPRPGNANSNIFDSQKTATSDTAKNPRAIDDHHHHDIPKRRNHAQQRQRADYDDYDHDGSTKNSSVIGNSSSINNDESVDVNDTATRRNRSQRKKYDHDDNADERGTVKKTNDSDERRSTSMPESSEYASQGSSYEKSSRHPVAGNGHNGHSKRGQFTRSLSNADVPPDEKVGEMIFYFFP